MLIERFKNNLGKSSYGGQTLYDHTMDCVKIALRILSDSRFVPEGYPGQKRDQLLFAMFIHDIGKLDPDFQTMLYAARDSRPMPSKRIKHEASTLDFEQLVRKSVSEIKEHLHQVLDYSFTGEIDIDDALAFTVCHHGLFYLSYEMREDKVVPRIRREWTVFNYNEKSRITLADLLFEYHPLGGLVIIADLITSFCYEQRIQNTEDIISGAGSLRELIDRLLFANMAEIVEESLNRYDMRAYGLRNLLILLAGGLV